MVDVISFDGAEGTHFFVVATKYENGVFFEEAAAALASGDVELDSFIDVPLVFLDAVIFTSFELYFLDVFIASKSVDGSASFGAHGGEEGLLLKHGSFVDDVLVPVLLAVVAHSP